MVNIHHQQPFGAVSDEQAVAVFQHQWEIYRIFVESEYASHTEVYGILHRLLHDDLDGPFRLLDLACGDVASMVAALNETQVAHYHGIDLAEPALNLARNNLEALSCEVTLERGDFIEAMRERTEPAHVVWIGLSLHHLAAAEKRTIMSEIREILHPEGFLAVYEAASPDGETREGYLDRYEAVARCLWASFTPEQLEEVFAHVRTCDFPETTSSWNALGREAGFSRAEHLFTNPTNLFRMYRYWP